MPICNPTIQLVVVDLYTKYEVSILNGCGDIFDEKVLRNYGRTDGRTDGTTDRCKPVYPPLFQSGGRKMEISVEKTKLMTNSANGIQRKIKVKGQKLGSVTSFKYLKMRAPNQRLSQGLHKTLHLLQS